MGAQEILYSVLFQLASGPFQVFVVELKQVKTSYHGMHGRSPRLRAGVFKSVDDSRMAATQYNNQTPIRINHQRHVLGNSVFGRRSIRHLHLAAGSDAEVPLRENARDRPCNPNSRVKFYGAVVHNHSPAQPFIHGAHPLHWLPTAYRDVAFQEDPLAYMRHREGGWILITHRPSERDESPSVISVIVGEDDVRHVHQIDFQLANVVQYGLR